MGFPMAAPILSGFPSPETLKEYENHVPGFGQTLLDEAIKQREALERAEENAHQLAMRRLELEAEAMRRGQRFGLTIGIVAVLAGTTAVALGASLAGGFIGGGGVIGLVAVFVAQNKDRDRYRPAVEATVKP
jgi:uncharacterized membrane protein